MGKITENCKCPKLFEELDRQGMTQKEFAMRIGASTGNVSDWVTGKSSPSRRRWKVISEALGKPIEELMGDEKKEPAGEGGLEGELDKKKKELLELLSDMEPDKINAVLTLLKAEAKK